MVKNLKKLRNEHKISQEALSNVIGVSQQAINKYENHNSEPDIAGLIKIARYFNVSVDYLIGNTDEKHKYGSFMECDLNEHEVYFLNAFRLLNSREKKSLLHFLRDYTSNKNKI